MHSKKNFIQPLLCLLIISSFAFINHPVGNKQAGNSNAATWMRHTKYGIMVHYLEQLQNEQQPWNQGKRTSWDSCVNDFDVNGFAKQMHDMGAGYVLFTVYQSSKFMSTPNATFEKATGYKRGDATPNRDLISDLYTALSKYNIPLMLYVTGDGMYRDNKSSAAFQNPILKWKDNGNKFIATPTFVNNWSSVLKDISVRYGKKISGWWVDGAFQFHGYNDSLLGILSNALKAGNPNAVVAFNPSPRKKVMYYSRWDDYTAGEMYNLQDIPPANGKVQGVQWHEVTFVGSNWQKSDVRFKSDSLTNYINQVNANNGVITFEVALLRNGSVPDSQYNFMKGISQQVKSR